MNTNLKIPLMPFFTIIIPVFNTEAFLKECLESVINQEYTNFECIIINDGSPNKFNDSQGVEEIYSEVIKSDQRFKYIQQVNKGVAIARNRGLDVATGEFIIFLDSDDLFHKQHLTKLHWLLTNIALRLGLRISFFRRI